MTNFATSFLIFKYEISCLICYFLKSRKIRNCLLLQIIGGALMVNCFIFDNFFSNIADALVSKGLATVIRYRMDDDQRSSAYDLLLAAEARAQKKGVGLHSKKDAPIHRVADIAGVSIVGSDSLIKYDMYQLLILSHSVFRVSFIWPHTKNIPFVLASHHTYIVNRLSRIFTILEDFENTSPYFCTFLANRICD